MMKTVLRWLPLSLFAVTLAVMLASLWFQYGMGMHPCPLCIMQRLCVGALLVLTPLLCLARSRCMRWSVLVPTVLVALLGLFFAGRQVWLQSLPAAETASCIPDVSVLFRYFPVQDVLKVLFLGTGDCAERSVEFLKLSMAGWSLLYFVGMLLASGCLMAQNCGEKNASTL